MPQASAQPRSEFVNESDHVVGVVIYQDGKPYGIPIKPGDSAWLTEDEEIATANAPKRDDDNPFINGDLVLKTRAADVINRRPIGTRDSSLNIVGEGVQVTDEPEEEPLDQGNKPVPPPQPVGPALAPNEETAAPPMPEGDPEHGIRAPGEEVGTPEAVPRTTTGRRQRTRSAVPAAGVPVGVAVGQGGPQYSKGQ